MSEEENSKPVIFDESENNSDDNEKTNKDSEQKEIKLSSLPPEIPKGEPRYVVLQETNEKEMESWYYFLRYDGNEDALQYLSDQLDKIDMILIDDCSTFDLDLDHFFCERTAKEMIMLEVNTIFHRKFDGKVKMINLQLKKRDGNEDMIYKVFEKLGMGQIEDYAEDEDVPDDGNLRSESESGSGSESDSDELLVPPPSRSSKQSKLITKELEKESGRKNNKKKNKRHANQMAVRRKH